MHLRPSFNLASLFLCMSLAACGGSGSGGGSNIPTPVSPNPTAKPITPSPTATPKPITPSPTPTKTATPTPTPVPTSSAPATANVIFGIDAGANQQVGSYQPDTDYNGGTTTSTSATINTSKVSNPAPMAVYQTQRSSPDLMYTIPELIPSNAYVVRLHFAESTYTASGKRLFSISINGNHVLSNYDIFAAAGGANIANIQTFTANANANGQLIIELKATTGTATLAGLDLALATVAGTQYPLYSAYFTGSTPFHATAAYLTSLPGTVQLSSTTVQNFWNQTWYNIVPAQNTPVFSATPHTYAYTFSCTLYGTCDASGKTFWSNTNNLFTEDDSDHHIVSVDPISGYEIDGWGGGGAANNSCNPNAGVLQCSWGGIYYYNSNGLDTSPGSTAVHAGFAIGIFILNAQDMLNGLKGFPIAHALGIRARCLDNLPNGVGATYPADTSSSTDSSCDGQDNGGPNGTQPAYGDYFVLNMSTQQIAATSYSPACKVILNALATYGAYLMDTGGGNNAIWVENPKVYGATNNPWYSTIEPQFGSDGNNQPGTAFTEESCMNRLSATNFKMYQIQKGSGQ